MNIFVIKLELHVFLNYRSHLEENLSLDLNFRTAQLYYFLSWVTQIEQFK